MHERESKKELTICIVAYHYDDRANLRPNIVRHVVKTSCSNPAVVCVTSNFDHFSKTRISKSEYDVVRIDVPPYYNNISLQRVWSYWKFAKAVAVHPAVDKADLLYICMPDYASAILALRRRDKLRQKKAVILDVLDLWPEALPFPKIVNWLVKLVLAPICRATRSYLFNSATLVLFQSEYFLARFGGSSTRYRLLPMCFGDRAEDFRPVRRSPILSEVRIVFLGALNYITDLASLVRFLRELTRHRRVYFDCIGGGHSLPRLQAELSHVDVVSRFHGIDFSPELKARILGQAHFGYNGYKDSTEVAVSYKSVEYLGAGVPLINSTKGDTAALVQEENCGINFHAGAVSTAVETLLALSDQQHEAMCKNARHAFQIRYSYKAFRSNISEIFDEAVNCMKISTIN